MTRYNIALLSLLVSTASAVPHYNQHGHRHPVHPKSGSSPSGVFPTNGVPTGGPTTAPYGLGNTTTIAPTGSGSVTSSPIITSVVTVVPEPVTRDTDNSPIESSLGNSPVGASSGAGEECGPATITVTSADTVTVTVPASSAPAESTDIESPIPATSAPFGNGTTSAPIGTGIPGTASSPLYSSSLEVITPTSTPEVIAPTSTPEEIAPTFTPEVIVPTSSPEVVAPTTSPEVIATPESPSEVYESPSVAQPIPSAPSSIVENSPETPETPDTSAPATTTPPAAGGAQFFQVESTPAAVPSSEAPKSSEPATSSTPKPATAPPSTDNVVPRGLVYNEASLTSHFDNANVGWLYNWDQTPGGTVPASKEFVPMLWDTLTSFHAHRWAENAAAAIAAGSKHLLAFNEPDLPAQANMDVPTSVKGWREHMEPFHAKHNGDVKLGSPSVCNGPDANQGLQYLASFLEQCAGCHVDFLAIHWYGLATEAGVQNLKDHIGKATAMAGGRPVWLTEFAPTGSDEEHARFLESVLPWLDDKSNGVERYAYFKVESMVSGGSLNKAGAAYAA
ncbi:MAG: hypothetical protein Q9208_000334 [Pyrenodesmia sp. 3 TL-2023]